MPSRSDSRAATSSRSGDVTRTALLSAAHDLLASEGPGALSVRRIAAAAGVSTMNVYSRFGGKDGVLEELFVDGFRRLDAAMAGIRSSGDTLGDLFECGAAYRRFARENPTYYTLMFDKAIPEFQPSDAAMEAALGALGRVVERVARAMEAGTVAPGDPHTVASGLWACEHGLVTLEMRHGDHEIFDWDAITASTLAALVRGFGAAS